MEHLSPEFVKRRNGLLADLHYAMGDVTESEDDATLNIYSNQLISAFWQLGDVQKREPLISGPLEVLENNILAAIPADADRRYVLAALSRVASRTLKALIEKEGRMYPESRRQG